FGFPPENRRFVLSLFPRPEQERVLRVETRSLLGIMYYLSHNVEVSDRDIDQGLVTVTRDANGALFDWDEVTGDVLKVRSSGDRPGRASISVYYRGTWFYLDDADLNSKSTFSLLGQIFSLQSGEAKDRAPLLTLPVGGS
ncbi:MAG: hypothetical protein GWM98_17440, partial [Nitrospinaceae bacterium]|nr:hypothetical protein [Nitrospinaceae bacterium]NIR55942.1 hypothetical protein [Nitrospinaceae bacterium]NIS86385.1 hypothetical protein [Nitrospinaceae bacterium]NIT83222.1 hypothetical protein [Nitrospinaceae bacterium]NIU45428.1 hypothetical protein [Nitrospinaceae bacterium]